MNPRLQAASDFLNQHETCVIATSGADGQPEAATIGFSHINQAGKWSFFIGTNSSTRKFANLQANAKCAFVVGFEGTETVQFEGIAQVADEATVKARLTAHLNKVEMAKRFVDQPGQTWFVITPTWLRHTDFKLPKPVFETKDLA